MDDDSFSNILSYILFAFFALGLMLAFTRTFGYISSFEVKTELRNFRNEIIDGIITQNEFGHFESEMTILGCQAEVSVFRYLGENKEAKVDPFFAETEADEYSMEYISASEVEDALNTFGEISLKERDYVSIEIHGDDLVLFDYVYYGLPETAK